MSDSNKRISRRWHEAWGTNAYQAVCDDCLAVDFRADVPGHGWVDRQTYVACVRSALGAFAEGTLTIDEAVAEDDSVMLRLTWTVIGTSRPLSGFAVDRFRGGRIVEHRLVVDRLTARRELTQAAPATAAALDRSIGIRRPAERLPLRSTGRVRFIKIADIEWVDAAHNYVRIHTLDGSTHVAREALGELEVRLDPERFVRIHRSTIINADCVRELELSNHGIYVAILSSGHRVTVGRSFKDKLPALLGA